MVWCSNERCLLFDFVDRRALRSSSLLVVGSTMLGLRLLRFKKKTVCGGQCLSSLSPSTVLRVYCMSWMTTMSSIGVFFLFFAKGAMLITRERSLSPSVGLRVNPYPFQRSVDHRIPPLQIRTHFSDDIHQIFVASSLLFHTLLL